MTFTEVYIVQFKQLGFKTEKYQLLDIVIFPNIGLSATVIPKLAIFLPLFSLTHCHIGCIGAYESVWFLS